MSRICMILFLGVLVPLLLCGFDLFRTTNGQVKEGNTLLSAGKVKEAVERYEQAVKELPDEPGVQYNLGIALYQLGKFDAARQAMLKATMAADPSLKAKSFYNLGNAQFETKQYKEAVSAYTRALQLQPGHQSAKWNLELALKRLAEEEKKKKEEEEKNKKNKKDKDKDKDKDKQQQDNKDKKQHPEQKDGQDKEKQQPKDPEKKQQDKPPQKPKPNPEQQKPEPQPKNKKAPPKINQQMQNVLDALDQNDKNLQRQRARMLMNQGLHRPSKDW